MYSWTENYSAFKKNGFLMHAESDLENKQQPHVEAYRGRRITTNSRSDWTTYRDHLSINKYKENER